MMTTKTTMTMTMTMVILLLFVVFLSYCSFLHVVAAIETTTAMAEAGTTTAGTGTGTSAAAATTTIPLFIEEEQEIQTEASSSSSKKKKWMNIGGPSYSSANTNTDSNNNPNVIDEDELEWILTDPSVYSFDVYSKIIRTQYSQVHWTNHGTIPLPQNVIERYSSNNRSNNSSSDTMAIVGYEVDQVMIDEDGNKEVSVPITWAYNHHYMAYVMGEDSSEGGKANVGVRVAQRQRSMMVDEQRSPIIHERKLPDSLKHFNSNNWIFISEGNGGEMRKSYHSYPRGYAQLIHKPQSFSITPMQIDTWNRKLMPNISDDGKFVPPSNDDVDTYLLPKSSQIRDLHESKYNPLMECPCTDRLKKRSEMTYILRDYGNNIEQEQDVEDSDKQLLLDNSTECFNVALKLLPSTNVTTRTINNTHDEVNDKGHCIATVHDDGSLDVVWNTTTTTTTTTTLMKANQGNNDIDTIIVGTTPIGSIINVTIVLNITSQIVDITMNGPYIESHSSRDSNDRDNNDNGNDNDNTNNINNEVWFGIGLGSDSMCIHMDADECTTGGPYTIVIMPPPGDSKSTVVERKLEFHGPGKVLTRSNDDSNNYDLKVLSNHIEYDDEDEDEDEDEERTIGAIRVGRRRKERSTEERRRRRVVKLQRPFQGPTDDYYSFLNDHKPLKIIIATGCNGSFGQHCGHQSPSPIVFAEVNKKQEIIRNGIKGYIDNKPFNKQCLDEPYGDLIKQKNPTCAFETYRGGQICCIHDKFLLDTHQTIPWSNQPLEYRMKFRFYYQDFFPSSASFSIVDDADEDDDNEETTDDNSIAVDTTKISTTTTDIGTALHRRHRRHHSPEASHQDLIRFYWQTEAGSAEYDVPQCEAGTPISQCVHVITSHWKVKDFVNDHDQNGNTISGIKLIYAGPHCHAQACLSMELYNADTGKLLCSVQPIRGGDSKNNNNNNNNEEEEEEGYNEEGFIAIPPCLWSENNINNSSSSSSSLSQPDFLSLNTTLMSIKRANSTFPHTGEMASWQMRGIVVVIDETS